MPGTNGDGVALNRWRSLGPDRPWHACRPAGIRAPGRAERMAMTLDPHRESSLQSRRGRVWGMIVMKRWDQPMGRWIVVAAGAIATATACGLMTGCQPGATGSPAKAERARGGREGGGAVEGHRRGEGRRAGPADADRRGGEATGGGGRRGEAAAGAAGISYGGEVMIPPGRLISVSSPFLGTVEAPPNARVPLPGATVEQGQPIFVVRPILSPEARATLAPLLKEADGQVKSAQEQLKIQKTALDRSEELVRQKLMPQASLVNARANHDVAETALHAAEARRDEILKIAGDPNAGGGMTTLTFRSPAKGILQNVHAQVGQPVPAGACCSPWPSLTRSGSGCRCTSATSTAWRWTRRRASAACRIRPS